MAILALTPYLKTTMKSFSFLELDFLLEEKGESIIPWMSTFQDMMSPFSGSLQRSHDIFDDAKIAFVRDMINILSFDLLERKDQ